MVIILLLIPVGLVSPVLDPVTHALCLVSLALGLVSPALGLVTIVLGLGLVSPALGLVSPDKLPREQVLFLFQLGLK